MKKLNPFRFRGPASVNLMAGRENEKKQLLSIIKNSQSAVLYAPRRTGKTWLLEIVAKEASKEKIIPVYFDLFPISSVIHFIESYATAIIKSIAKTSKSAQELFNTHFSFLNPQITFSKNNWLITYNWERTDNGIKRLFPILLALPESIAKEKKAKLVVIFDEFQEIDRLDGEKWEKEMRSIFQQQKRVSYIFSGSKTHLLVNMFTDVRRPFYQSSAMILLSEISNNNWKKFISKKLKGTNVNFIEDIIDQLILLTGGHPYYTQLLCYFVWEKCNVKGMIISEDVTQCLTEALYNEYPYFGQLWDGLPLIQKQLLISIAKEGGRHIFSGDFMIANSLGPVSSIRIASIALSKQKEILDKVKDEYKFTDPFFRLWIRREIIGFPE